MGWWACPRPYGLGLGQTGGVDVPSKPNGVSRGTGAVKRAACWAVPFTASARGHVRDGTLRHAGRLAWMASASRFSPPGPRGPGTQDGSPGWRARHDSARRGHEGPARRTARLDGERVTIQPAGATRARHAGQLAWMASASRFSPPGPRGPGGREVEARGVEPLSRDVSARTSTCVSGQLESRSRVPGRQGASQTSPEQI